MRPASGAPDGLVVVADHPARGPGSARPHLDRAAGRIAARLGPAPSRTSPPDDRHLVVVAAAVAMADAVAATTGVVAELKWPNDLLVGDRKLAGILAEAAGDASWSASA